MFSFKLTPHRTQPTARPRNGVKPLSSAKRGQTMTVVKVSAGRRATHRLTEMGLTPGVELKIVQDNGGPLLLAVRGSRLAVGRGLAHKVMVDIH